MKVYLIFYLVLFSTILFSIEESTTCKNTVNIMKSKNFPDEIYVRTFTIDRFGNIILITSNRNQKTKINMFNMIKLNSKLEKIWEVQLNINGVVQKITTDKMNDIVIVSEYFSFEKSISSISKYNQDGELIWTTTPRTKNEFAIRDIDFDESNNIYIVGYHSGYVRIGLEIMNTFLPSFRDGIIAKLTSDGDWVKCKDTDFSYSDYISNIEIIGETIYTWGGFESWSGILKSFFSEIEAEYNQKYYIAKYSTNLKKQLEFRLNDESSAILGPEFPIGSYVLTSKYNKNFIALDYIDYSSTRYNANSQLNVDVMIIDSNLKVLYSVFEIKSFKNQSIESFQSCIYRSVNRSKSCIYDFSNQTMYIIKPEENEWIEHGLIDNDLLYLLKGKKNENSKNNFYTLDILKIDKSE